MGYYAYSNCNLEFRPNVILEDFVSKAVPAIDKLGIWCHLGCYKTFDKDGNQRTACCARFEYEGNYHEEDVAQALEILAPYVEDGSIVYFDGDDAKWCFELGEDGKWVEWNCYDYYECDLDYKSQFKIERQGFRIGLTDDELRNIYNAIGRGEIRIDEEEE